MILIPVKNQHAAKQRLALVLNPGERFLLAQAMLEDVLESVAEVSGRPPVALVTGDPHAQKLAARFGCEVIEDRDERGETAAIEMATRSLAQRHAAWALVIPGDAPLTTAQDVEAVLAAAPAAGCVLVPDAKGRGTNAALRRPPQLFPLRFGDDSFLPHLRAAVASGAGCVVRHLPRLALDVDSPADLRALAVAPGRTRAQELLRLWRVAARLRELELS